jgi:hypothetical protein
MMPILIMVFDLVERQNYQKWAFAQGLGYASAI